MDHAESLEPRRLFAVTLPKGFSANTITSDLHRPTTMAFAPDGRLFIAQQDGALRVVRGGKLLDRPVKSWTVDSDGERGLIGVTTDRDYLTNHYVYVYHTVPKHGDQPTFNQVSRFVVKGDVAVPHSEHVVFNLSPLSAHTNHNGGAIHFGPDGKLYIATGDNARQPNAQELTNTHGKILRVFADGRIPHDNPFAKAKKQYRAIWAIGFRNPFNFSFNRNTGRMIINDVGAETWEEIDVGKAGANYGWPDVEGPMGDTSNPHYTAPIFSYHHGNGPDKGEAIVGSASYAPVKNNFGAAYDNDYFFADLSSGWIRTLDGKTNKVSGFASGITLPVSLTINDADGTLYYLNRSTSDDSGTLAQVRKS